MTLPVSPFLCLPDWMSTLGGGFFILFTSTLYSPSLFSEGVSFDGLSEILRLCWDLDSVRFFPFVSGRSDFRTLRIRESRVLTVLYPSLRATPDRRSRCPACDREDGL